MDETISSSRRRRAEDRSFTLSTDLPWSPLPDALGELSTPRLDGTLTLADDGSLSALVTHSPLGDISLSGGDLVLTGMQLEARVEVPEVSASALSSVALRVALSGGVRVGGSGGFSASVWGSIDTAAQEASLGVSHAGGWAPLPGLAAYNVQTPAFNGSLTVGMNPMRVALGAVAKFTEPIILVPDVVRLAGLPSVGGGPSFGVAFDRSDGATSYDLNVAFAVELGSGNGSLPLILVDETISSSRRRRAEDRSFTLSTDLPWSPLPDALGELSTPRLDGTLTLADDGSLSALVTHSPLGDISLSGGDLVLTGMQLEARVEVPEVSASALSSVALRVALSGGVQVGGSGGFSASVWGSIDTAAQEASLGVSHAGGWAPLPGLAAYNVQTPAFNGSLTVGMNPMRVALGAVAKFTEPIILVPDVVRLAGLPSVGGGPSFGVAFEPLGRRYVVRSERRLCG